MRNRNCVWSALGLVAVAGMAGSAMAAGPVTGDPETNVYQRLPVPIFVDDMASLEIANKLGLNQAPQGGLRGVTCDPIGDITNCHTANLTLGANFSGAAAGSFRTMDNFTPSSSNPTQLCWIGRYANRVNPVAGESFQIRIFADNAGLPDLASGPIYDQTFTEGGGGCSADWDNNGTVNSNDISAYLTAWLNSVQMGNLIADFNGDMTVNSNDISAFLTAWLAQIGQPCTGGNVLELSCLAGDTCPGTTNPVAGGHWVFSAEQAGGFPVTANGCYWIEIANVGSNAAGTNWGWVGSTGGTDLTSLQAIDGAYTAFTRVANDRSFCFSGGVNPFLGGCTIAPLPPVCSNDAANGIPDVGPASVGFRASAPGSIGRTATPGAWTPFQRAEEFTFSANTTVDSICFGGFWLGVTDAGGTVGIAAPSTPAFNVTYFVHDYMTGLPGMTPVASFNVGDPGVSFVWDGDDVTHLTHPAVNFTAGTCYYVSIGNLQIAQATGQPVTPLWHWFLTTSSTPTGNELIHSRALTTPPTAWGSFTLVPTNPSNLWFLLSSAGLVTPDCPPPPPPPVPANDECGSAIALATPSVGNPTSVNGTTLGALVDAVPDCVGTASTAGGVWYTITGTGAQMTASMCATVGGYDSQIAIYTGSCAAPICVGGNDDGCGAGGVSNFSWPSNAGETYLIHVYGWGNATGNFTLDVSTQ